MGFNFFLNNEIIDLTNKYVMNHICDRGLNLYESANSLALTWVFNFSPFI